MLYKKIFINDLPNKYNFLTSLFICNHFLRYVYNEMYKQRIE